LSIFLIFLIPLSCPKSSLPPSLPPPRALASLTSSRCSLRVVSSSLGGVAGGVAQSVLRFWGMGGESKKSKKCSTRPPRPRGEISRVFFFNFLCARMPRRGVSWVVTEAHVLTRPSVAQSQEWNVESKKERKKGPPAGAGSPRLITPVS
jgi:hypothetical protein